MGAETKGTLPAILTTARAVMLYSRWKDQKGIERSAIVFNSHPDEPDRRVTEPIDRDMFAANVAITALGSSRFPFVTRASLIRLHRKSYDAATYVIDRFKGDYNA